MEKVRHAKSRYADIDDLILGVLEVSASTNYKICVSIGDKVKPEIAMKFYRSWLKNKNPKSDPDDIYPTLEMKLEVGLACLITNRLRSLKEKAKVKFNGETWTLAEKLPRLMKAL